MEIWNVEPSVSDCWFHIPNYMLIDIICTIVQWRISALFSKGVNAGIL